MSCHLLSVLLYLMRYILEVYRKICSFIWRILAKSNELSSASYFSFPKNIVRYTQVSGILNLYFRSEVQNTDNHIILIKLYTHFNIYIYIYEGLCRGEGE